MDYRRGICSDKVLSSTYRAPLIGHTRKKLEWRVLRLDAGGATRSHVVLSAHDRYGLSVYILTKWPEKQTRTKSGVDCKGIETESWAFHVNGPQRVTLERFRRARIF